VQTPAVAQSVKLLEANSAVKILSAIDQLVDQATQPQLDDQLVAPVEKQPASPTVKSTQQIEASPTQVPATPSQPKIAQLSFRRSGAS